MLAALQTLTPSGLCCSGFQISKCDTHLPEMSEGPGALQANQFPSSALGKVMEQITLDVITWQLEDRQWIMASRHRLRKGKFCLANLILLCDKVTCLVNEGMVLHVVHLDFSKAFYTVSDSTILRKLTVHGLYKLWCVKSWLDDKIQGVVVNGVKSSCWRVISGILHLYQ